MVNLIVVTDILVFHTIFIKCEIELFENIMETMKVLSMSGKY